MCCMRTEGIMCPYSLAANACLDRPAYDASRGVTLSDVSQTAARIAGQKDKRRAGCEA